MNYDDWKLDTPPYCEPESDAEQAAAIINAHIADSLDLTAMDVLAVAGEEEGTVTLYVGEYHCGSHPWSVAIHHWLALIFNALRAAIAKERA